jgi:hypothetical protein
VTTVLMLRNVKSVRTFITLYFWYKINDECVFINCYIHHCKLLVCIKHTLDMCYVFGYEFYVHNLWICEIFLKLLYWLLI